MKTHFIRITSLALCLLFAISMCACNKGDKDLKLSDLKDMTSSEAKSYFGKPDREGASGDWIYDDGFSFYGIKIDMLSYDPSDHSVEMSFLNEEAQKQASAKIREFCTFDSSFGSFTYYKYNNIKVTVSGFYFGFKFS